MSDQTNAALVCIETRDQIIFFTFMFTFIRSQSLKIIYKHSEKGHFPHNITPPSSSPPHFPNNAKCFVQLGFNLSLTITLCE